MTSGQSSNFIIYHCYFQKNYISKKEVGPLLTRNPIFRNQSEQENDFVSKVIEIISKHIEIHKKIEQCGIIKYTDKDQ